MKKSYSTRLLIAILIVCSRQPTQGTIPSELPINPVNFNLGEHLVYHADFGGWLNIGTMEFKVADQFCGIAGRNCYKIEALGASKLFKFFLKMHTYLDSEKLVSKGFYRRVQEGKYRKTEQISFDHDQKLALVEVISEEMEQLLDIISFPICENTQDILSNAYTLRTQDFSQAQIGQVFLNSIFFNDFLYENLQNKFLGVYKGHEPAGGRGN